MSWSEADILNLLGALRVHRGDTTNVEVKRASGGLPEDINETVCAFGNMPDGGTILLGVDERANFQVTGINNPAQMEAGLVSKARSTVEPVPRLNTYAVTVEGQQVVVAEVVPLLLMDRPCSTNGRAYLRQADGNYVMHEHELRMIEVEKTLMARQQDYDSQKVEGLTVDDLVPTVVDSYLSTTRARVQRLRDRTDGEILQRTGVLVSSGEPTLAGLYAMGDFPQGPFPSLTVTAAVQLPASMSGERNRDLQQFTGPIPTLLDDIMAWCRNNLSLVRAYREDGHMTERTEVPMTAVRELVANALVHRDLGPNTLGAGKSIQIRLTPTNLFIQSPGGLRGVSVEQLRSSDHAQAAVNQRLYTIAQKLTTDDGSPVIEGEGGGIREVFRSSARYGLRTPDLINKGVEFKALLWRPDSNAAPALIPEPTSPTPSVQRSNWLEEISATHPLSKNEPLILSALHRFGPQSLNDLRYHTGLNEGQLRYGLAQATSSGLVEMVGGQGQRSTVYRVAPQWA